MLCTAAPAAAVAFTNIHSSEKMYVPCSRIGAAAVGSIGRRVV